MYKSKEKILIILPGNGAIGYAHEMITVTSGDFVDIPGDSFDEILSLLIKERWPFDVYPPHVLKFVVLVPIEKLNNKFFTYDERPKFNFSEN